MPMVLHLYPGGVVTACSEYVKFDNTASLKLEHFSLYSQVADPNPTGTFLDDAIFSDILRHHQKDPERPRTAVEWIIQGDYKKENTATVVLESLVQAEILGRESKLFGRRYPMLNPGMLPWALMIYRNIPLISPGLMQLRKGF